MIKLQVYGKASKRLVKVIEVIEIPDITLMDFLRAQNIPIASSCYGEGICQKCVINQDILSCQLSLKDILHSAKYFNKNKVQIEIDYL